MEKVKITQEQADLIEKERRRIEDHKIVRVFANMNGESSSKFHIDELIRALYIGYEVEPEFKAGDWIVFDDSGEQIIRKIIRIDTVLKNRVKFDDQPEVWFPVYYIDRHAIPKEIAAEKTRRWWAKHNRDVWELREFDELRDMRDDYRFTVSEKIDTDDVGLLDSYIEYNFYRWDEIKEHFAVVCFAEDRKDK